MIRFHQPADLGALPADKSFDIGNIQTQVDEPLFFEIANLSGYPFEVQDETGSIMAIAGALTYTPVPIDALTQKIILHPVGTQANTNFPIGSWAVYCGITKHPIAPSSRVLAT